LDITTSYVAKLSGAMRAVEIAFQNNWKQLWIELDSALVVSAFNNLTRPVAWQLRNRWKNVLFLIRQMNCVITHIYREGNQVADMLTNHGLNLTSIVFWNEPPLFIRDNVNRNKLRIPNFRFCST
jgi:ribonuclease HI